MGNELELNEYHSVKYEIGGIAAQQWKGDDWFRCALPISARRIMDLKRGPPLFTSVGPAGPDEIVAVQMLVSLVPKAAVSKRNKVGTHAF